MTRESAIPAVRNALSMLALVSSLFALAAHAQAPPVDWVDQFGTPVQDVAFAIASDASVVFIGGLTDGALDGPSSGAGDAYLRQYDVSGNVIWARQFGSSAPDSVRGVSLHASEVYVVGHTFGVLPGQSGHPATGDPFVQKYDTDGNEIWTRQFGTPAFDVGYSIATHDTGVYVVGGASGALPGQPSGASVDAFVRKYDFDGNEVWTRQFFGSAPPTYSHSQQHAYSVTVDETGVYLGGEVFGAFPNNNYLGETDGFLRKYDHNGNELWTRQFGTVESEAVFDVATDGSGIYVAGVTNGALPGQTFFGGHWDIFVRKYDFDGDEVWTQQFGTDSTDRVDLNSRSLVTDGGHVYVVGRTGGTLGATSFGGFDVVVRKYDPAGNHIWTFQFGTTGQENIPSLSVGHGSIFVGGSTLGAFDGETNAGGADAFLARMAPANTPPVADAGDNQLLECTSPAGTLVTLDGSASFDPDTDPLTHTWTGPFLEGNGTTNGIGPMVTLPLGIHEIRLVVNDGQVDSDPDTVLVTVHDTKPPNIVSTLHRLGSGDEIDDDDEGRFRIGFTMTDTCDSSAAVTAVLVIPGVPEITVSDGQVIEFEFDDERAEVEWEDGILEIEAPALTLKITATDASGNSAITELPFKGLAPDNNDDTPVSTELDD